MKRFIVKQSVAAACLLLLSTSPAHAHGMRFITWVDGGTMCAEGGFSATEKAAKSTVVALDGKGVKLHEGVTNAIGVVCFPLPEEAADITFIIDAGQGHTAKAVLHGEDIITPKSKALAEREEDHEELEHMIEDVVRQELQKQLGPLRQTLAAMQNKGPGLVEIFGGIGWLVGLAGAAAFASSRRRQK